MNIWIDITNSPHVLFFNPIIRDLKLEGHNCIVTARDYSHTIDLLKKYNIGFKLIGGHQGKSILKKAFGYLNRNRKLKNFIINKKIDVAISHQSPYAMAVSKKLGIKKRIYVFDNEHAKWQNRLAFRSATSILCPSKINGDYIKYQGIKEAIYLCEFSPNSSILDEMSLNEHEYIVFRPEPFTAAYYSGGANSQLNFLDSFLENSTQKVVLIPRDLNQKLFYLEKFGSKIIIPDKVVNTLDLIYFSHLFIGGGGTMNREAAALGTPVISTYDGQLLAVDKYLIKNKFMHHSKEPTLELISKISSRKRGNDLANYGKLVQKQIIDLITVNS